ncbi:MAG: hypothetical protein GXP62_10010 [Oligoflexia bacterium]|nr:hypothetical protein [Oligoflexia bacterium]
MKTGDTVHDPSGRTFKVGQLLGHGLWGKTYSTREEPSGAEWVLKVPLGADAFSTDGERLARICREIGLEQGRLLSQDNEALLRPELRFTTESGVPVLVLPKMSTSLAARAAAGAPLKELLDAVVAVVGLLRGGLGRSTVHGNVRPVNILSDGQGRFVLTDPLTDTLQRNLPQLARARKIPLTWLPPEARARQEQALTDRSIDSHALAAFIFHCATTRPEGTPTPLPDDGLDKASLVRLKDAVRSRLSAEPGNVRFQARLSDRLATLLNRALSRETSPSPPYRFPRMDQFQTRVAELASLVDPQITHVGRLLLDRPPGSDTFTTDEDLAFSCSVGCSPGVETHEDIACGLAVFDVDADKRLRGVPCSYTVDRHPSGRFRFGFRVAGLPPGSYRIRLAFTIRDSGHEPSTVEGTLQVHPAAGYVPPRSEPEPQAIRFSPRVEPDVDTQLGPVPVPRPAPVPTPKPAPPTDASVTPRVASATDSSANPGAALPRPIAPNTADVDLPAQAAHGAAPGRTAGTVPITDLDAEPEYRGAGRWTDLPLPGGPALPGPDSAPAADDLTQPLDVNPNTSFVDRLLDLAQGETYKLFIGGALALILLLILALALLR